MNHAHMVDKLHRLDLLFLTATEKNDKENWNIYLNARDDLETNNLGSVTHKDPSTPNVLGVRYIDAMYGNVETAEYDTLRRWLKSLYTIHHVTRKQLVDRYIVIVDWMQRHDQGEADD